MSDQGVTNASCLNLQDAAELPSRRLAMKVTRPGSGLGGLGGQRLKESGEDSDAEEQLSTKLKGEAHL